MWKPICFYKLISQKDSDDNEVLLKSPYHKCRAEINCTGGREYYEAKQLNAENEVTFRVRFCRKLKNITPQEFCIEFDGQMYDITYIDNYMMSNEFLKVKGVVRNDKRG